METYWESKWKLSEFRAYKIEEKVYERKVFKKSNKINNLKRYNHLDTDYKLGGFEKVTQEREEKEDEWIAENYELITNL
jgi:hypothetical protein